nr:hypothetical protein [uncultured Sphingomonas sp.]
MILLALALQAAAPQTAVEAERAFNAAAQAKGQWTAFREFAAEEATMFVPEPVKAQEWLKDRKDPPIAVQWWPAESFVSCDGMAAVNTGPWVRPRASGYFTTVWVREPDGRFQWVYDGGDQLTAPRALPKRPKIVRAACNTQRIVPLVPTPCPPGERCVSDWSRDQTLVWESHFDSKGARHFETRLWNGKRYDIVTSNVFAAPK